jgi:hypothetical protein
LVAYWFYQTECWKLDDADIADDDDREHEISDLEEELVRCGLQVLDHLILPVDLAKLRQNFLAKRKKRQVFGNTIMSIDERDLRFVDDPRKPIVSRVEDLTPEQIAYMRNQAAQTRYRRGGST